MVDSLSRSNSFDTDREPYEIVIDKNLRSRAKRVQDDTREELTKVLERVENTLVEYEKSVQEQAVKKPLGTNVEFLVDINELENILSDKVEKFKYKQKITVFIVGQSELMERRNILLEQLNEFFNDQSASFDPNQIAITDIDFDLDQVKEEVDDCYETAKIMTNRLDELNENIVQYLIANSTTKQTKSKKKLEKSLKDQKDELTTLSDRLQIAQTELSAKDEKIKHLIKQLEIRSADFKFNSKNFSTDAESQLLRLKIKRMDQDIKALSRRLVKVGSTYLDLTEELNEIREEEADGETGDYVVEFDYKDFENLNAANKVEQDIEAMKKDYEKQIEAVNAKLKQAEIELSIPKKPVFPSGKNAKGGKGKGSKGKEKSMELISSSANLDEENLDTDAENEKQLKMIEDLENGGAIEDIDLTTDDWVNVAPSDIVKRYDALRRYAVAKITDLKSDYVKLETNDKEKIEKLKKQYYDHRKLWETEKLVLLNVKDMELVWDEERTKFLDQAEEAMRLQQEAQTAAEKAIQQLEEFITEDAQLDRENAEATLQLLRERSRTITSLSMAKQDEPQNLTDDAKIQDVVEPRVISATTNINKIIDPEHSEKVQVVIENYSIKFPNKNTLQKIIDYVNFESTNKYTLILNNNYTPTGNSRPGTTNRPSSKSRSNSILKPKSAQKSEQQSNYKQSNPNTRQIPLPDRKSAKSFTQLDQSLDLNKSLLINESFIADQNENNNNNNNNNNIDMIDQVLSKVMSNDEIMINELRNNVRSRNSLRTKHLAQLEETKASLNEIRNKANQQRLNRSHSGDMDFPASESRSGNNKESLMSRASRDSSGKREDSLSPSRSAKQLDNMLSRLNSSKSVGAATTTTNILSHPIVLEYIKTYDIIANFQNLIIKSLPSNKADSKLVAGFLSAFQEKLRQFEMMEFDAELTVTPQIVKMTTNVDQALNDILIVFTQIVDDFVAAKYDLIEKEQQIVQLKQQQQQISTRPNTTKSTLRHQESLKETSSLSSSNLIRSKLLEQVQNEQEVQQKKKDSFMAQKELELKNLEVNLLSQAQSLEDKIRRVQLEEAKLNKERMEFESRKLQSEKTMSIIKKSPIQNEPELKTVEPAPSLSSDYEAINITKPVINGDFVGKEDVYNRKFAQMKESYESMQKHYQTECQSYLREIDDLKIEIERLNDLIRTLQKEAEQQNRLPQMSSSSGSPKPITQRVHSGNKESRIKQQQLPNLGQLALTTSRHSQMPMQPPQLPIQLAAGFGKQFQFHNQIKSQSMSQIDEIEKPDQAQQQQQQLGSIIKINQIQEPNVMFTRLDAERNIKRLRRALTRGSLNDQTFENASKLMEDYMTLPSKRFVQLVKKYTAQKQMEQIQENILKNEENLNVETVEALEKMQKLQEKRGRKYHELVRGIKEKRLNLALDLTETLEDIERQSGIFLIKPFYSYQGKNSTEELMRLNKMSRIDSARRDRLSNTDRISAPFRHGQPFKNLEYNFIAKVPSNLTHWNFQESFVGQTNSNDLKKLPIVKSASAINLFLNTPKILELDINRMMISQNQISATINPNDKFSSNLRSYVAINRPTGALKNDVYEASIVPKTSLINIENRKSSASLPPISKNFKSPKNSLNEANLMNFENNEIAELASLDGSDSVATIDLSRTNTDVQQQ